jgi:cyclopropane-fatty-acyl-phospholipid synthase
MRVLSACLDYPRTLRTWGYYMNADLTPEAFRINPLPTCDASREENNNYEAMVRKWQYLFAYASVGFARGHVTW